MVQKVTTNRLSSSQFFSQGAKKKNQIVLHHTAGSHRADWVISGWEATPAVVGTPFIIGGLDTQGSDKDKMNGVVYEAFPDTGWAWSLAVTSSNRTALEKGNVGIEMTNYGYVVPNKEGKFISYVGREIHPSQVVELSKPFKGYKFWHKYTDLQLESAYKLIKEQQEKWGMVWPKKKWTPELFERSNEALSGQTGVFVHSNYAAKFDCSPQPRLIEMLNSL